ACNNRPIGVSLLKFHNNFLADARDVDGTPILASPGLRNADPAGALVILLAQPVPEELNFHSTVFVRVNFLAGGPNDDGGLKALDNRLGSESLRAEGNADRYTRKVVAIGFLGIATGTGVAIADGGRMCNFGQKVIAILVAAGMIVQVKFVAGSEGAAVAGTGEQVMHGLFFFHADLSKVIAVGFLGVDARIIVDFVFGIAANLIDGLNVGHKRGAGRLEIIIVEGVLAGPKFLLGAPTLHDVFLLKGAAGGVIETDLMLDGAVFVDLGFVGEDELMGTLVMLEEIEDSVFLHEAGNKIEGRLTVLDDIFSLGVGGLGAVLKILKTMILENFLDDFWNGFLLKDLAIGGASEKPKPGNDFGLVVAEAVVAANGGEAADKAIPETLVGAGQVYREGHLFADDVLERDGVVFGKEFHGKMEQFRDGFMAAEIVQQQDVAAQRR